MNSWTHKLSVLQICLVSERNSIKQKSHAAKFPYRGNKMNTQIFIAAKATVLGPKVQNFWEMIHFQNQG